MAIANDRKKVAEKTMLQKVNAGARVMDAVLALVFLGLAFQSGWWFWWASAVLCIVTAVTAPMDKIVMMIVRKFLNKR